jgi:hypothetical protein
MDRVFSYKGFNICAFEKGQDRWFAEIQKTNGSWIIVRGERRESPQHLGRQHPPRLISQSTRSMAKK